MKFSLQEGAFGLAFADKNYVFAEIGHSELLRAGRGGWATGSLPVEVEV